MGGAAWWYKPEYIINELNINSVITTPSHEEILSINSWTRPYTLKGYAYSGKHLPTIIYLSFFVAIYLFFTWNRLKHAAGCIEMHIQVRPYEHISNLYTYTLY